MFQDNGKSKGFFCLFFNQIPRAHEKLLVSLHLTQDSWAAYVTNPSSSMVKYITLQFKNGQQRRTLPNIEDAHVLSRQTWTWYQTQLLTLASRLEVAVMAHTIRLLLAMWESWLEFPAPEFSLGPAHWSNETADQISLSCPIFMRMCVSLCLWLSIKKLFKMANECSDF